MPEIACITKDFHIGDIEIGTSAVAHRVISEKLRERILLGKLAPGTELPSTLKIAGALIDLVCRQHAGNPIAPALVPSVFEESLRTV